MKNKEYNKKINNFLTSLPALPYSPQGENKKFPLWRGWHEVPGED
jgi:hypothetical protein